MSMKNALRVIPGIVFCMILTIGILALGNAEAEAAPTPEGPGETVETEEPGETAETEGPLTTIGDINGDGKINAMDVTVLRRFLAGGWGVTIEESESDLNADGQVSAMDVTLLRRFLAGGWGVKLPERPTLEPQPVAVEQKSLNTVNVIFNKDVSFTAAPDSEFPPVTLDRFSIYYMDGEDKVSAAISRLRNYDGENIVTAELAEDLVQGEKYYFEYDGKEIGWIVTAKVTVDSVEAVVIPSQSFTVNHEVNVVYYLLDQNGVRIESSLGTDLNGKIELNAQDAGEELLVTDSEAPKVICSVPNKTYNVSITYKWTGEDGYTHIASGSGQVYTLPEPEWELQPVTGVITETGSRDYVINDGRSLNPDCRSLAVWALGDPDVELQIAVPYMKMGEIRYETLETAGTINSRYKSYSLMSADEAIVMICEINGNRARLSANKCGITNIVVYGVKDDGKRDVIGVISVQVPERARLSMLSCTMNKSSLDLDNPDDCITLSVNAWDQYARWMPGQEIWVRSDALGAAYLNSGASFNSMGEYTVYSRDFEKGAANYANLVFESKGKTSSLIIKLRNSGCPDPAEVYISAVVVPDQNYKPGEEHDIQYYIVDTEGNPVSQEDIDSLGGNLTVQVTDSEDYDMYVNENKIYIGSENKRYTLEVSFNYIDFNGEWPVEKTVKGSGFVASFVNDEYIYDEKKGAEIFVTTTETSCVVSADGKKEFEPSEMLFSMDAPQIFCIEIAVPYFNANSSLYEGFEVDLAPNVYKEYVVKNSNDSVIELGEIIDGKLPFTFKKEGISVVTLYGVTADNEEIELASKEILVHGSYKNQPEALSAKQVSLDSFEVTFDKKAEGITPDDFCVYYVAGDLVKIYHSTAAKVTVNEEKAIVKMYSDFVQGNTYYIEYRYDVIGSFVAASVNSDSVAGIEVVGHTVEANKINMIQYRLLDANGVDLTEAFGTVLNGTVTMESKDPAVNILEHNQAFDITITEKDKTCVIVGKYTWTDKDGNTRSVSGEATYESKEPLQWELGDVYAATVDKYSQSVINFDGSLRPAKEERKIILDGREVSLAVGIEFRIRQSYERDQYYSRYVGLSGTEGIGPYTEYKVVSTDENVLGVSQTVQYDRVDLIPVSAGQVTLEIYGIDSDGQSVKIGEYQTEVYAPSAPAEITAAWVNDNDKLNLAYENDSTTLKVWIKDQYGYEMNELSVDMEQIDNSTLVYNGLAFIASGSGLELTPDMISDEGFDSYPSTVTFRLKCGEAVKNVTLHVDKDGEAAEYVPVLSGNKLDTAIAFDTEPDTIRLTVEGRNKNGFKTDGTEAVFTDRLPKTGSDESIYADGTIIYIVKKDGVIQTQNDLGLNFENHTFTNIVMDQSMMAVKMQKGTYEIVLYRVGSSSTGKVLLSPIGTVSFDVVDNQVSLQVYKRDNAERLGAIDNDQIGSAFDVKFKGFILSPMDLIFSYTVHNDRITAYVSSVSVWVGNNDVGYFQISQKVDAIVKKA